MAPILPVELIEYRQISQENEDSKGEKREFLGIKKVFGMRCCLRSDEKLIGNIGEFIDEFRVGAGALFRYII